MNEYREFQKSLRIKKEQLESSLKEELKQLEQKHRQELQDLKTLHQRKRTQLTQELTLEREQRALDRLNKSMVSVREKEKLDETKSTKKRKRTNNNKQEQEQVTSDVELTVNEIVEEIIQNDEKENKKQKKSPNTTVDQDYDKDAVDVVDENDVCEESVVKISSSSQQLHSTQQSIPPCAQIERTLSKRRSSASIQNENENEKVAECERHE